MTEKTLKEYEIQNMITQTQYVIDKARKDISETKEELKELIMLKIERARIKLKEKRRKKYRKKLFAFLLFGVFLIPLVGGILFLS